MRCKEIQDKSRGILNSSSQYRFDYHCPYSIQVMFSIVFLKLEGVNLNMNGHGLLFRLHNVLVHLTALGVWVRQPFGNCSMLLPLWRSSRWLLMTIWLKRIFFRFVSIMYSTLPSVPIYLSYGNCIRLWLCMNIYFFSVISF